MLILKPASSCDFEHIYSSFNNKTVHFDLTVTFQCHFPTQRSNEVHRIMLYSNLKED